MTQKREEYNEELIRITAHYVEEVESGRHPRVGDYIRQYPDYADAITDFVAYYHTFEAQLPGAEDEKVVAHRAHLSPATQTSLQTAYTRVYVTPQQAPQAIITLFNADEDKQVTLEQLTQYLHLSEDMVMLLEQRHLNASSIPLELCRRLAVLLQKPVSSVRSYFLIDGKQEYVHQHGQRVRVAETQSAYPMEQKRSFLQALEESAQMTEEQRAFWRACVSREQAEV